MTYERIKSYTLDPGAESPRVLALGRLNDLSGRTRAYEVTITRGDETLSSVQYHSRRSADSAYMRILRHMPDRELTREEGRP